MRKLSLFAFFFTLLLFSSSLAFESDELLVDDEEFGIEGGSKPQPKSRDPATTRSTSRKRFADQDSDSKIQFSLEHAFGDSDFVPAGTFTARLKTSTHGGQVCRFPCQFLLYLCRFSYCLVVARKENAYDSVLCNLSLMETRMKYRFGISKLTFFW